MADPYPPMRRAAVSFLSCAIFSTLAFARAAVSLAADLMPAAVSRAVSTIVCFAWSNLPPPSPRLLAPEFLATDQPAGGEVGRAHDESCQCDCYYNCARRPRLDPEKMRRVSGDHEDGGDP